MSLVAWYPLDEIKTYNHSRTGSWYIINTNQEFSFEFPGIPIVLQNAIKLRIDQNDLEGNIDIEINGILVVDGVLAANNTREWKEWDVPSHVLRTDYNIVRIFHNGGSADWGYIYEANLYSTAPNYVEDASKNGNEAKPIDISIDTGKINQAGIFNGTTSYIDTNIQPSEFPLFSYFLWVNPSSFSSAHGDIDKRFFTAKRASGSTLYAVGLQGNTLKIMVWSGTSLLYSVGSFTFSTNTYYHIAVTYNGEYIKAYVNGNLDASLLVSCPITTEFYQTIILGDLDTSTRRVFSGQIDDVRIYDHALSEKEIKELSKGKILHYKFDDFQEPTENLYRRTSLLPGGTAPYTIAVYGKTITGGSEDPFGGNNAVLVDTTNQTSALYRYGATNGTNPDITYGNIYTFSIYAKLFSEETKPSYSKIDIVDRGSFEFASQLTHEWQRFSTTTLHDNTSDYGFVNIELSAGHKIYLSHPQLEAKDHVTPFVDGTRTGLVKDVSGYENNAELSLTTTPKWMEEGIIGKGAYYFDGSKELVTNKLFFDNTNQEWTATGWVKLDVNNTYQQFNNFNLGNRIIHSSLKALLYANNGVNDHYVYSSSTIPTSQWVHIAFVYRTSDRTCKFYLNGNLDASSGNYDITDIPSGFAATTVFGTALQGYIDDVRIYATALSADDVKELYQTKANLDGVGNFFLAGITESSDKQIDTLTFEDDEPIESSFPVTTE